MRTTVLGLTAAVAGGAALGWLGLRIGIMTGFLAAVAGVALGWYAGARFGRQYLD